ncbi:PqqD family protein [Tepidibacillus sp. LV47]|uniref:PqqD family protein n=1 Tax=Tepidibacillus sp. LV47 TaxID=3398228 RepID=UPI003AAB7CB3
MAKKISRKDNILELVPKKTSKYESIITEDGVVQIIIPRNRLLDRIVRMFKNTPKVMRIDLDKIGTYIWKQIDGKRDIQEIGRLLKLEFGDEIEPLYERLITYMNILRNNKFIILEKKEE